MPFDNYERLQFQFQFQSLFLLLITIPKSLIAEKEQRQISKFEFRVSDLKENERERKEDLVVVVEVIINFGFLLRQISLSLLFFEQPIAFSLCFSHLNIPFFTLRCFERFLLLFVLVGSVATFFLTFFTHLFSF